MTLSKYPTNLTPKELGLMRRKNRRDKFISADQFKALLDAAQQRSPRDHAFIYIAGNVGLRVGEVLALHVTDCEALDNNYLRIPTEKKGVKKDIKRNRNRAKTIERARNNAIEIPIHPDVANYILKYIHNQNITTWLFPGRNQTKPMTVMNAQYIFDQCRKAANLPLRLSPHALRHFRGLTLYETTGNLTLVQQQLRHASVRTSLTYIHLSDTKAKEYINALPPVI